MINQRLFLASLLLLAVFLSLVFFRGRMVEERISVSKTRSDSKNLPTPQDQKVSDRRVLNLPSGKSPVDPGQLNVQNSVSNEWKEELEKTLRIQGGKRLKDVEVSLVDSFIWAHEGTALYVESVLITLTDQNGERTKFKAMIDSSNGKILQTWDRPVIDPINPRERTGIKLDPRYHND